MIQQNMFFQFDIYINTRVVVMAFGINLAEFDFQVLLGPDCGDVRLPPECIAEPSPAVAARSGVLAAMPARAVLRASAGAEPKRCGAADDAPFFADSSTAFWCFSRICLRTLHTSK